MKKEGRGNLGFFGIKKGFWVHRKITGKSQEKQYRYSLYVDYASVSHYRHQNIFYFLVGNPEEIDVWKILNDAILPRNPLQNWPLIHLISFWTQRLPGRFRCFIHMFLSQNYSDDDRRCETKQTSQWRIANSKNTIKDQNESKSSCKRTNRKSVKTCVDEGLWWWEAV